MRPDQLAFVLISGKLPKYARNNQNDVMFQVKKGMYIVKNEAIAKSDPLYAAHQRMIEHGWCFCGVKDKSLLYIIIGSGRNASIENGKIYYDNPWRVERYA